MLAIDAAVLLGWSARICAVGLALQSLELIVQWPELRDRHLLGWQGDGCGPGFTRRYLQWAQGFPVCLLVLLWRAGAATAVALAAGGSATSWLVGSLLLCQLYYIVRFQVVFTNADHVNLVVLAAVTVGLLPGASTTLRVVALGFAAFQALLAYVASGVDKLRLPHWRDGTRLTQVFRDSAHRFSPLGRLFARWPVFACGVAWSVALVELLFPLGLLLPAKGFLTVALAGLAFHASIAVFMGLPAFLWAFAATYPAMYYFNAYITAVVHR